MLTNNDLKQIGDMLEAKLEEKLESKLEEKLETKLEEKLESKLEEKLQPIRMDISSIKNTLDEVIGNYDEGDTKLNRRVTRIEKHLNLPAET